MSDSNNNFHELVQKLIKSTAPSTWLLPSELFGHVEGKGLDIEAYRKTPYFHPRDPEYYDRANPDMAALLQAIRLSGQIDPIVVYPDINHGVMVLDGAKRVAVAAWLRAENPDAFTRIPVTIYRKDSEAARGYMVAANMVDRRTPLSPLQIANVLRTWRDNGKTDAEICAMLGRPDTYKVEINKFMALLAATPELKAAVKAGAVKKSVAIEAAVAPPEKQKEVAKAAIAAKEEKDAPKAKAPTVADVRKERRAEAAKEGKVLPGRKQRPSLKVAKFSEFLGNDFTSWLKTLRKAVYQEDRAKVEKMRDKAITLLDEIEEAVRTLEQM